MSVCHCRVAHVHRDSMKRVQYGMMVHSKGKTVIFVLLQAYFAAQYAIGHVK